MSDEDFYVNGRLLKFAGDLGRGGEARVVKGVDGYAYKIWEESALTVTDRTHDKVTQLIRLGPTLPQSLLAPLAPVLNARRRMRGFRMRLIPPDYIRLSLLVSSATWKKHRLSQIEVAKMLINLHDLFSKIHKLGWVFGDANISNFGVNPTTLLELAWDIDSCQLGEDFPCLAGAPTFLAPRQYNKDLRSGRYPYIIADDWWAFTIIAFETLTRGHPYPTNSESEIPTLVMAGRHVLNPAIPYPGPRVAVPPKTLPNRTLALFRRIFENRQIDVFPREELVFLIDHLRQCPNHVDAKVVYAVERTECPVCAKDQSVPDLRTVTIPTPQVRVMAVHTPPITQPQPVRIQIPQPQSPDTRVRLTPVWTAQGAQQAVFTKTVTHTNLGQEVERVLVLVNRNGRLIARWIDPANGQHVEYMLSVPYDPMQVYDVNRFYLSVGQGDTVTLYNHRGGQILRFQTASFAQSPVVGLGAHTPVWMMGNTMVVGELRGIDLYARNIREFGDNVWFTVGHTATQTLAVGFTASTRGHEWFSWTDGVFNPMRLPLGTDELLMDVDVVFHEATYAILRRVQRGKLSRIRVNLFDTTKPVFEEVINAGELSGNATLFGHTLLVPTTAGIIRLKQGERPTTLPGTQEHVPADSLLTVANKQLIVITPDANVYQVTSR